MEFDELLIRYKVPYPLVMGWGEVVVLVLREVCELRRGRERGVSIWDCRTGEKEGGAGSKQTSREEGQLDCERVGRSSTE
jgi:hypothetical protein